MMRCGRREWKMVQPRTSTPQDRNLESGYIAWRQQQNDFYEPRHMISALSRDRQPQATFRVVQVEPRKGPHHKHPTPGELTSSFFTTHTWLMLAVG